MQCCQLSCIWCMFVWYYSEKKKIIWKIKESFISAWEIVFLAPSAWVQFCLQKSCKKCNRFLFQKRIMDKNFKSKTLLHAQRLAEPFLVNIKVIKVCNVTFYHFTIICQIEKPTYIFGIHLRQSRITTIEEAWDWPQSSVVILLCWRLRRCRLL